MTQDPQRYSLHLKVKLKENTQCVLLFVNAQAQRNSQRQLLSLSPFYRQETEANLSHRRTKFEFQSLCQVPVAVMKSHRLNQTTQYLEEELLKVFQYTERKQTLIPPRETVCLASPPSRRQLDPNSWQFLHLLDQHHSIFFLLGTL